MRFPETLEKRPCKICGTASEKDFNLKYKLENCEIVQCRRCGFVFVPSAWRRNLSYTAYKTEATAQEVRKGNNALKLERHKLRLRCIKKFKAKGRLLDVGSGWGHFLLAARNMGYDVLGVELDSAPYQYSVRDLGLPVLQKDFFEFSVEEKFDVITMWDVLEHIDDPGGFLRQCARLQNPGSVLVLQVPQIDSCVARCMGKNWKMLGLDHVNYFSPKTLRKLLENNGYEVLKVRSSLELKLLLMYTIYPAIEKFKAYFKRQNLSPVDNTARQAFFNKITQRPSWQIKFLIFLHNGIYNFLSFLKIGEEMMVVARRC